MQALLTVLAMSIAVAVSAPAFAQKSEPKTQAECVKKEGMRWDPGARQCVKK
jgi:hypothetical protein